MSRFDAANLEGLRIDGRRVGETRRVVTELGHAKGKEIDGSAIYNQGNTQVVAFVSGPKESKRWADSAHDKALIKCIFYEAAFSSAVRRVRSKSDRKAKEYAEIICSTFESIILTHLFPRSSINITIQVMQDDGGVLACAINAASMALINAGVPMLDMVVACSVGLIGDRPVLDLSSNEKRGNTPIIYIGILAHSNKVVTMQLASKIPLKNLDCVMNLAMKGCDQIYACLSQQVKEYSEGVLQNRVIL